jgi:hypothetical protein
VSNSQGFAVVLYKLSRVARLGPVLPVTPPVVKVKDVNPIKGGGPNGLLRPKLNEPENELNIVVLVKS